MRTQPTIAIVHDWLYGGGAEQVVLALHQLYPDAPIYTSYCSRTWRKKLDNKVITGYLQRWPFAQLRRLLPVLRQRWFARLDLGQFDIIISSSGNGEAKFIQTRPDQRHICYCHTPTHFYWRHYQEYLRRPSFRPRWLARLGLRLLVRPLRRRSTLMSFWPIPPPFRLISSSFMTETASSSFRQCRQPALWRSQKPGRAP